MDNGVRFGEVAICLPLAIMIDLVLDVINPRKAGQRAPCLQRS